MPPLPHLATRSLCVATAAGGDAHSKTARRFGERTNLEWNWSRVFDPSFKILHLKKFPNSWGQADGRTIAARSHQTIARGTKTEHVADIALPAAKSHPSLTPSRALTCLAPRCVNPQKSRPRPNMPRRPRPNPRLSFPSHEFVANEVIGTRPLGRQRKIEVEIISLQREGAMERRWKGNRQLTR